MKKKVIINLVAMLILALGISAYAADYPTKPITLMVAYPAGGETDIGARILAAIAEKDLGQPIIVVNKGGPGDRSAGLNWPGRKAMVTISVLSTRQP